MNGASSRRFTNRMLFAFAASALLIGLCTYRILTFSPQPFDSPATLRPAFYACFSWFVHQFSTPAQAQRVWGAAANLALLIPALLAFWNYHYSHSSSRSALLHRVIGSRLLLFGSIGACLFICRLPFLLANEINPDETFFIAAAEKLFKDPVFFRAIDFSTSGPLNVYPLMIPAVFAISPDYVSTRLIALLIIFASIYVIYRTLALLTDDASARIALLPASGAFAVLKLGEFLPFSSEHLSFLLLSLALYLGVKILCRPQSYAWNEVGLGALTAAAFLAKMQAVPIVVSVAAIATLAIYRSGRAVQWWKPVLLFAAGLAPLLLLNTLVCLQAGVWHDFWIEYIVANYNYVAPHGTLAEELRRFSAFALGVADIRLQMTICLATAAAYVYWRARSSTRNRNCGAHLGPVRWFAWLAFMTLAAAAAAAYIPHRPYGHYLLLLIIPLAITTSSIAVTASARPSPLPFLLVFVGITLACQLIQLNAPDFVSFADIPSTVRAPESKLIAALTRPNEGIAVWGWDGRPYVGSGRVSALKDLISGQLFLTEGPVRAYYRAAYLSGLQNHRPELFIDAAGTSFLKRFRDRATYGFELIPEINAFIQSNYVHLLDGYGQRYYIRRDLASRSPQYPSHQANRTALWSPSYSPPQALHARLQTASNWVEATPQTDDPQLFFDIGPTLGRFPTLIIRAWFAKADRIDLFFGKQVEGRGVNGIVPVTGQWLDVYCNMSQNQFWKAERGNILRFDPASSAGPGATARIAGIWGSTEAAPAAWPDVQFLPAQ